MTTKLLENMTLAEIADALMHLRALEQRDEARRRKARTKLRRWREARKATRERPTK